MSSLHVSTHLAAFPTYPLKLSRHAAPAVKHVFFPSCSGFVGHVSWIANGFCGVETISAKAGQSFAHIKNKFGTELAIYIYIYICMFP